MPSFLSLARSCSTLGPELSPSQSTEYTPLPLSPLVPLATATPPAIGTPEVASPFVPAGYLALVARNKWRSPDSCIGVLTKGPMIEKTIFRTYIAAPSPPRTMFVLTGPGKSWMKDTSGAFLARASSDKVTSELACPRADSAGTFQPWKSLVSTGPSLPAANTLTTRRRAVACWRSGRRLTMNRVRE